MKNYYITKHVFNEIPHALLLLIQTLSLERLYQNLDYLQVFETKREKDRLVLRQRSEVPYYLKEVFLDEAMVEGLSDFKIYVIETDLDVTMLFAHEY
ncbi:MAG: DUF960 family protein [Paracholeplasma sp.]|uniref:Uncharacterized protein n=1 Tax=Acholeplasma brassicae TaxID=61635 RepID=U4KMP9_9MOLU|nr:MULTISPECIES: DUF960 family protein [Paracholeplasma]MDY3196031.1 DUF960 family protein [Paracholeplasma sp.]CCV65477.1 hypothetical protein (DUF960, Staphylococcal species) [Paracholeplasma brassicae]